MGEVQGDVYGSHTTFNISCSEVKWNFKGMQKEDYNFELSEEKEIYSLWIVKMLVKMPLRKHAYSNLLKILQPKMENFQIKKCNIFHISAQNINCGYSLEPYSKSMFLSNNKKNNIYPCKSQFYYIKVGFKGVKII